jgi:hypothetical protein
MATSAGWPTRSVWPSGGAATTLCAPIDPLAPARFSTTTLWPSAAASLSEIIRATMSPVPPGA